MKVAHLSEPAEERVVFRDGLGVRERRETSAGEVVEWFHLDPAFAAVEHPLRERVTRLTKLQHAKFARIMGLETAAKGRGPILVSSHVAGTRLSEVLEMAGHGLLTFEPGAGLQVTREVLAGLAVLHDSRNVSHGALAPERVVLTAPGRIVMVEHVLAHALDRLQRQRHQLWREWRIPTPPAAGPVHLDMQTDLAQAGLLALAALLGRPLDAEEYPHRLRGLLPLVQDRLARSPAASIGSDVVAWLERLAPVDSRRAFKTVREAQQAFEGLVSGGAAALGISPARVKNVMAAVSAITTVPAAASEAEASVPAPATVASVVPDRKTPTSQPPARSKQTAAPPEESLPTTDSEADSDIDIEALLRLEAELEGGSSTPEPALPLSPRSAAPRAAPTGPTMVPPVLDDEQALEAIALERVDLERQFAELVASVAPADDGPAHLIPETPATSEPLVDARVLWSSMPAVDLVDAIEAPLDVAERAPFAPDIAIEPIDFATDVPVLLDAEAPESAEAAEDAAPFAITPVEAQPAAAIEHVPTEWWREALPWRGEAHRDDASSPVSFEIGEIDAAIAPAGATIAVDLADGEPGVADVAALDIASLETETITPDVAEAMNVEATLTSERGVGEDFGYLTLDVSGLDSDGAENGLEAPAVEVVSGVIETGETVTAIVLGTEMESIEVDETFVVVEDAHVAAAGIDAFVDVADAAEAPAIIAGAETVEAVVPEDVADVIEPSAIALAMVETSETSETSAVVEASDSHETPGTIDASQDDAVEEALEAVTSVVPAEVIEAAAIGDIVDQGTDVIVVAEATETDVPVTEPLEAGAVAAEVLEADTEVAAAEEFEADTAVASADSFEADTVIAVADVLEADTEVAAAEVLEPDAVVAAADAFEADTDVASADAFDADTTVAAVEFAATAASAVADVLAHDNVEAESILPSWTAAIDPIGDDAVSEALEAGPSGSACEDASASTDVDLGGEVATQPAGAYRLFADVPPIGLQDEGVVETSTDSDSPFDLPHVDGGSLTAAASLLSRGPGGADAPDWRDAFMGTQSADARPDASPAPPFADPFAAQPVVVDAVADADLPLVDAETDAGDGWGDEETIAASWAASSDGGELTPEPVVVSEPVVFVEEDDTVVAVASVAAADPDLVTESETEWAVGEEACESEEAADCTAAAVVDLHVGDVAPLAVAEAAPAVPEVVVVDEGTDADVWNELPSEVPGSATDGTAPIDLVAASDAPAAAAQEESTELIASANVAFTLAPGLAPAANAKRKKKRSRRKKGTQIEAIPAALPTPEVVMPAASPATPPVVVDVPLLTARPSILTGAPADHEPSAHSARASLLEREVPTWTPPAELTVLRPRAEQLPAARFSAPPNMADAEVQPISAPTTLAPNVTVSPVESWGGSAAAAANDAYRPFEQEIRAVGMPDLEEFSSRSTRTGLTSMADPNGHAHASASTSRAVAIEPRVVAGPEPSRGMNWRRLVAASVLIALFQGAAFAAWWWVQPGARGTLVVQTSKIGVEVLLDDKVVGRTPFREEVAPGRHKLGLRQGSNVREMPVEISVGVVTTQAIDWPSLTGGRGNLQVTSNPAGAQVFIDGKSRGDAPLLLEDLPAGDQVLTLKSDAGTVTVTTTVVPDETTPVDVKIFAGWILVDAPVEVNLLLNGREKIGSSMDGQILLPPGTHRVQAINEGLGIRQWFSVTVEPGAVRRVPFTVAPASLTLQEEAEVFVDGTSVGTTPGTITIQPGTHEIVIRPVGGAERRQALTVRSRQRVEF